MDLGIRVIQLSRDIFVMILTRCRIERIVVALL